MEAALSSVSRRGKDEGISLMEVIIGVLVILILGSILIHLLRLGYAMYKLSSATNGVAHKLETARELAKSKKENVSVIFESQRQRFGIDNNGNGRLENIEVEELPDGVNIAEDTVVVFTKTGNLGRGVKEPQIIISNSRNSRSISVSSLGSVEID